MTVRRCTLALVILGLTLVSSSCGDDGSECIDCAPGDVGADIGDGGDDAGDEDSAEQGKAGPGPGPGRPAVPVDPLVGVGEPTVLFDEFTFVEGPVWDATNGRLWLSDTQENIIRTLTPSGEVESMFVDTMGANGLALDPDGGVIACEMDSARVTRRRSDGSIDVLADAYDGKRFNSPNDVVYRADGFIYFTDPPFRVVGEQELDISGLFRIAPDGEVTLQWSTPDEERPNGIALSPDHSVLYVVDTFTGELRSFDIDDTGSLTNEQVLVTGRVVADGMTVDDHWNIYVATLSGIEVFSPDGERWGEIPVTGLASNCAFGGPNGTTLYITARALLLSVEVPAARW